MLHKFFALLIFASLHAIAATPAELLSGYTAQAGQAANAAKGEAFFKASHGQDWQCTSCHGKSPMVGGRHASTDKAIEPLAPAANAKRFTDGAKVEKWFRRNCKDVLARECTAAEKADVLAWLITVR
jgi:uncharacterized membrane protein